MAMCIKIITILVRLMHQYSDSGITLSNTMLI